MGSYPPWFQPVPPQSWIAAGLFLSALARGVTSSGPGSALRSDRPEIETLSEHKLAQYALKTHWHTFIIRQWAWLILHWSTALTSKCASSDSNSQTSPCTGMILKVGHMPPDKWFYQTRECNWVEWHINNINLTSLEYIFKTWGNFFKGWFRSFVVL